MSVAAGVFAALAAAMHIVFFLVESVMWSRPTVWRRFGVATQEHADAIRPMAYNQGFYNLFLAIGVVIGLALFWAGDAGTTAEVAGRALVLFSLGSMLAAALVLVTSGAKYLRPATIQGTLPLIGFAYAVRRVSLTAIGLELKSVVEQFREQVQNLE